MVEELVPEPDPKLIWVRSTLGEIEDGHIVNYRGQQGAVVAVRGNRKWVRFYIWDVANSRELGYEAPPATPIAVLATEKEDGEYRLKEEGE